MSLDLEFRPKHLLGGDSRWITLLGLRHREPNKRPDCFVHYLSSLTGSIPTNSILAKILESAETLNQMNCGLICALPFFSRNQEQALDAARAALNGGVTVVSSFRTVLQIPHLVAVVLSAQFSFELVKNW